MLSGTSIQSLISFVPSSIRGCDVTTPEVTVQNSIPHNKDAIIVGHIWFHERLLVRKRNYSSRPLLGAQCPLQTEGY